MTSDSLVYCCQYLTGVFDKQYLPSDWPLRPFPSSKKSHFQNDAKCETFVVKMSFICIIIENHFHINGFALSLVLKVRFFWNSEMV